MSGFIRALVHILQDNQVSADAVVNTFYFDGDSTPGNTPLSVAEAAHSLLEAFYQDFDFTLFPATLGSTATVKYYDLEDPEPRVPVHMADIVLGNSSQSPLPQQVCMVLSFRGQLEAGTVAARRRGRVYIGPLAANVNGGSGTLLSRPTSAAITALVNAANVLATPSTVNGTRWSIFSPTTLAAGGSLGDAFHDVRAGYVDDSFDIQRRRKIGSTFRTTFTE